MRNSSSDKVFNSRLIKVPVIIEKPGGVKNNIADGFLESKIGKPVVIEKPNGIGIKGELIAFDCFTILLKQKHSQTLIYKHAIHSIK